MIKLVWIAVGGGIGSVLRYWLAGFVQRLAASPGSSPAALFPVGTLTVNVLGSLALGFLACALAGPLLVREELKLALTIGLLGGFTTFSTFAAETFALGNERAYGLALLNIVLNNGLAIAAALVGYRAAERIYGV